jgi:hypothetical protein
LIAAKALAVLTAADKTATPARFKLRVAMHVVGSAAADAMAPPARRPLLVEAPLAAATLKNVAESGRQRERVLFIGTEFSILYTSMHSPA